MKKLIYASLFILILMISCTSSNDFEKGKKQLEQQNYTNIKDTGFSWFCCDDKDNYSSGFTAIDRRGNEVEGCICSGYFKGVTIRFN
jgi:hypothetical protein